jgi:hypothetical protein
MRIFCAVPFCEFSNNLMLTAAQFPHSRHLLRLSALAAVLSPFLHGRAADSQFQAARA